MSAERAQAVQIALAGRRAGEHQRGLAGRLARTLGGNERTWARAVTDTRTAYAAELGHQDVREAQRPAPGPSTVWSPVRSSCDGPGERASAASPRLPRDHARHQPPHHIARQKRGSLSTHHGRAGTHHAVRTAS
ncbi:hypothetical protein [Streptomyces flavovirens]|uniref:Transposase n=1 Tax=Streptomyces flavovirens TaxID=52258 RepID=A0ABV8N2K8_9ACTN